MLSKVKQNPSQSAVHIYKEIGNSFTQNMQSEEKVLFLSSFPTFPLYRKRVDSAKSKSHDWKVRIVDCDVLHQLPPKTSCDIFHVR